MRLPANFSVEFDALFRHFRYQDTIYFIGLEGQTTATGNAWEFPLLAKYKLRTKFLRPYIAGGVAWDHLQGLSATNTTVDSAGSPFITTTTTQTSSPSELENRTSPGVVIGGGVDIHALFLHISPEVRYTRWTLPHFELYDLLNSNKNQVEFLLGVSF